MRVGGMGGKGRGRCKKDAAPLLEVLGLVAKERRKTIPQVGPRGRDVPCHSVKNAVFRP